MDCLYVDNFRGFQGTYVPLAGVNFLVGENSTGKTSILSVLCLLNDPDFWFTQQVNTRQVQLGTFRDIVSTPSRSSDQFRLGMLGLGKEATDCEAFLLQFKEKEGLPVVARYDYYDKGRRVTVLYENKRMRFRTTTCNLTGDCGLSLMKEFNSWTKQRQDDKGFKILPGSIAMPLQRALIYTRALVASQLRPQKGTDPENLNFELQMTMGPLSWIAPVRSKPKRSYDKFKIDPTAEGDHTPYMIRKILSKRGKARSHFQRSLADFGRTSALLDSIAVDEYRYKGLTSPFALDIYLGKHKRNITNVGYGVSQCLPIVTEVITGRRGEWFAIQQPEVHLHPKAQAALGDLFFKHAKERGARFLIETHSDYLIDRYRLNVRRKKCKATAQTLFFDRTPTRNRIHAIPILGDGEYSDKQPKKFRDFFIREQLNLLGIE